MNIAYCIIFAILLFAICFGIMLGIDALDTKTKEKYDFDDDERSRGDR